MKIMKKISQLAIRWYPTDLRLGKAFRLHFDLDPYTSINYFLHQLKFIIKWPFGKHCLIILITQKFEKSKEDFLIYNLKEFPENLAFLIIYFTIRKSVIKLFTILKQFKLIKNQFYILISLLYNPLLIYYSWNVTPTF